MITLLPERCQDQVSQAGIRYYILQFTVGCNFLSLPEIPAPADKVHMLVLWSM